MRNRFSLYADDGTPAVIVNARTRGPFFLICEHASRQMPAALGSLGLNPKEARSHIAWDIGAAAMARTMAKSLASPLVLQRYSRLVFDCNRPPGSASSIPEISEATRVPGNIGLSDGDKKARADDLYHPFHAKIAAMLDQMQDDGHAPVIVTVHSFTPVYLGTARDVELGVIHDKDSRFADAVIDAAAAKGSFVCRRNDPYGPADGVTHTLVRHSAERGLLNVMLEVRNDLITSKAGQAEWAQRLCDLLQTALAASRPSANARARAASG